MKAVHWIVFGLTLFFAVWFVYRTRDTRAQNRKLH